MSCYATDVIGAITISKRFGYLDSGKDNLGIMASLHDATLYLTLVGVFPEMHLPLNTLMKYFNRSGINEFFKMAAEQVQAAKEGRIPKLEGFLTRMLQMHKENESDMSFLDMLLVCVINLGAGSDNTSIGLTGTMWGLINTPQTMAKVFHLPISHSCPSCVGTAMRFL
ncbi:hypothetical protein FJTKL_01376 [Diaporthe vaccinii]|uniref:Cytochrome P450 n=1 Tax=Diaporthe vaccinii TaxID=105482 RepID=A0ABR4E102_9PEZI